MPPHQPVGARNPHAAHARTHPRTPQISRAENGWRAADTNLCGSCAWPDDSCPPDLAERSQSGLALSMGEGLEAGWSAGGLPCAVAAEGGCGPRVFARSLCGRAPALPPVTPLASLSPLTSTASPTGSPTAAACPRRSTTPSANGASPSSRRPETTGRRSPPSAHRDASRRPSPSERLCRHRRAETPRLPRDTTRTALKGKASSDVPRLLFAPLRIALLGANSPSLHPVCHSHPPSRSHSPTLLFLAASPCLEPRSPSPAVPCPFLPPLG